MIWTADRIVVQGRARRGMGLDIAHNGRIRHVGPLAEMGAPDHVHEGQAIVLGQVNPYHHSLGLVHRRIGHVLRQVAPVGWADGDTVWDTWADAVTPKDMYIIARAAFIAALEAGTTCLGEVLSVRYMPDGELYPPGQSMADALLKAAQDVGIRLALIDNVRLRYPAPDVAPQPKCQAAQNLERACEAFDALVTGILTRHDARLSWALGAHSLDSVPYDSLVALRVRLGHMPFFLPQPADAGAQGRALRRYGHDPFVTLARRDVLDACMSIVTTTGLPYACAVAVAEMGTTLCLSHPPEGAMVQTPWAVMGASSVQGAVPAVSTGSFAPEGLLRAFADWPEPQDPLEAALQPASRRPAAAFEKTQSAAAAALGVDAGGLKAKRWGDFVTVRLPDSLVGLSAAGYATHDPEGEAQYAADVLVSTLSRQGIGRYLTGAVVAGQPVLTGQTHPMRAQSDVGLGDLLRRLTQSN